MRVPEYSAPTVDPGSAGTNYQQASTGAVAAAGAALGGAVSDFGTDIEKHADRLFGLQNEARARDADVQLGQALTDLQFNPQSGYASLQGKAKVDAYPQFAARVGQLRAQFRDALPNDEARSLYDQVATRRVLYAQEDMSRQAALANNNWLKESHIGRLDQLVNDTGTYWADDKRFAQSVQAIRGEVQGLGELNGEPAEKIAADQAHYTGEAWTARIKSVLAVDANHAMTMLESAGDQIDAPHRAALMETIENHQYTQMMRETAQANRDMVMAEKQLRQTQAATFAGVYADTLSGKAPDASVLANLVRAQKMTPEMSNFVLREAATAGRGQDDYSVLLPLQAAIGSGQAGVDDVMNARDRGSLSGPTADKLIKAASTMQTHSTDQAERAALQQARTLMGIGADEKPLVNLGNEQSARDMQLWGQFQGEWINRVFVNHEPWTQVQQDMLPRYLGTKQQLPTWLPQPRLGSITNEKDVADLAARTQAAFDAHELTPDQFNAEKGLLVQYSRFYQQKAQQDAARRGAMQPRAPGDQSKGISPAGGQP